jgi:hypothetical protein
LVVAQSFSKSFLMTGWRLGWMVLPSSPQNGLDAAGKLLEFNSSCAPVFVQRAGLAALALADTLVPADPARMQACRDRLMTGLQALAGCDRGQPARRHVRVLPHRRGRTIRWRWPSAWWPNTAWAWRRVRPLGLKARAGCAGVLRRAT